MMPQLLPQILKPDQANLILIFLLSLLQDYLKIGLKFGASYETTQSNTFTVVINTEVI